MAFIFYISHLVTHTIGSCSIQLHHSVYMVIYYDLLYFPSNQPLFYFYIIGNPVL